MRNILVTGASGALGSEVVRYFSSGDVRLLATYTRTPGLISKHVEWVQWSTTNLVSLNDLTEKLEQFVPLDLWIHLTGGFMSGLTLDNTPPQKFRNMLDLNLESFSALVPHVIPLNETSHLSVVLIGAEAGINPTKELGAYGVSKAALKYYMDVLSLEMKDKPVSVNMIVPTIIDTKPNRESMPDSNYEQWIKPEHICDVIQFLTSEAGKKINGSVLRLGK